MRRFSQRNSLVTLNEINVTPLLDLAFVLLIIFIITRPALEQTIDINLPQGGQMPGRVESKDVQIVEVTSQGRYKVNGAWMNVDQALTHLVRVKSTNPNMVVHIRADENSYLKYGVAIMDGCVKRGISRFSIRTAPEGSR
jgi:biopolymer transport protein ExbD